MDPDDTQGLGTDQAKTSVPFWRRLGALCFDGFVIGVPLVLLGLAVFDWAERLGQSGRIIGFFVGFLYFGILNSGLGGSQTLGKHLMGLKVVDKRGNGLTLLRSTLRFCVLAVPFFLNGFQFGDGSFSGGGSLALGTLLSVAVLGLGGAIVYLFVFNRPTRRSLHDLAAGSFVVYAASDSCVVSSSMAKIHLILLAGWFTIAASVPALVAHNAHRPAVSAQFGPLMDVRTQLQGKLHVRSILVSRGATAVASLAGGRSVTTFLAITLQGNEGPQSDLDRERDVARIVIAAHPDLLGQQLLVVGVRHGFDFGLASWSRTHRNALDAAGWQNVLGTSPLPENERSP